MKKTKRPLPVWAVVMADFLLFCLPGKLFRFLAMVRAGGISIRAALAGIRPIAAYSFCHADLLFHSF